MKFKTSNEPLSIFAYSSMTDIVMLLLIFFLLTSQFVIQTGVKVKLPGSTTNEQTDPSMLVVTLTSDGAVYVGNDNVGLTGLTNKLNALKGTGREDNLVIRADKTVAIELLIKTIDAAKNAGLDKFTIQTEKERMQ